MGHGTTYDDRASDREETHMRVPSARTRLLIHSAPYKFGSHHSTHRSAPLQIPTPAHPDLSAARPARALLLGARRRPARLPTRTTRCSRMMYAVRRGGLEIREAREVVGPVEQGPPARKLFILNPRAPTVIAVSLLPRNRPWRLRSSVQRTGESPAQASTVVIRRAQGQPRRGPSKPNWRVCTSHLRKDAAPSQG